MWISDYLLPDMHTFEKGAPSQQNMESQKYVFATHWFLNTFSEIDLQRWAWSKFPTIFTFGHSLGKTWKRCD